MLAFKGQETGSGDTKTNLTHKKLTPTIGRNIQLAEQYGSEEVLVVCDFKVVRYKLVVVHKFMI